MVKRMLIPTPISTLYPKCSKELALYIYTQKTWGLSDLPKVMEVGGKAMYRF